MSLTIKQIAQQLNVSDRSVYRFLKNHSDIENEYRESYNKSTGGRKAKLYKDEISFVIANVKNIHSALIQSDFEKGKKEVAKSLVQQAQELPSTEQVLLKAIELINQIGVNLDEVTKRIQRLEEKPKIKLQLRSKITRDHLRNKINDYCKLKGLEHQEIYSKLYGELEFRRGIKVMLEAKKRGKSGLDIVEEQGHLDEVYNMFDSFYKLK